MLISQIQLEINQHTTRPSSRVFVVSKGTSAMGLCLGSPRGIEALGLTEFMAFGATDLTPQLLLDFSSFYLLLQHYPATGSKRYKQDLLQCVTTAAKVQSNVSMAGKRRLATRTRDVRGSLEARGNESLCPHCPSTTCCDTLQKTPSL